MSEPDRPAGGRRRAAPLTTEAEAARARGREQSARSGRRRAVAGRRRDAVPPSDSPWTTSANPPDSAAPQRPRRPAGPDPWLQDATSATTTPVDPEEPWDPWATEAAVPPGPAPARSPTALNAPQAERPGEPPVETQVDAQVDPQVDAHVDGPIAAQLVTPVGSGLHTHRRSVPPPADPPVAASEIASGFEPWSPIDPAVVERETSARPSVGSEASDWTNPADGDPSSSRPVPEAPAPAGPTGQPGMTRRRRALEVPPAGVASSDVTASPMSHRSADHATRPTPRSTFRTEIHGLRGLAVLLVVVYHLWLGRVSGGVDVFLFLSAFFLTGAFARRLEQGRPLGLRAYWARTFQRLYPPATIVILGALALAVTVLPVTSWSMIQRHAVASSVYLQNVALALDSVDYYQHDASSASPLQHFWSLSIQGQVFLVWPLLIGLLALIGLRRRPRAVRPVLGVVFGMILVASLTWSVLETAHDQTRAYFDTSARLWEFAAGSLLALALPAIDRVLRARRPGAAQAPGLGALRALLGWAGIAGLIACGLVLDVRTAFPGWIALWPLGAAALVIIAGHSGTRWGVDRLLALRPVQGLGSISYSLYLVHWPLLVGWLAWYGAGRAGLLDGLGLLAGSIVIAWVLTVLVDRPLHRSVWFAARRLRSVAVVVVCLVVLAGGSTLGFSAVTTRIIDGAGSGGSATAAPGTGSSTATRPASDLEHPGAAWTGSPLAAATAAPTPRADQSHAPEDLMPQDCGGRFGTPEEVTCRIAPATGTPTATVLIAGDSHSAQYASAVMEAASSRGWTVYYVGKPGCSFSTGSGKPECAVVDTIWPRVLDELRPDVVLTLGSHSAADGTPEVAWADLPAALALVQDRGIPALVLRDNPRWAVDEYACAFDAVRSGGDARAADAACGAPLTDKLAATDPTLSFADPDPARRVVVADPSTEVLCPGGRCSPIIGNVYVYRDDDHLTADFSATMGPWIGAQLDQVLAPAGPSDG